MICVKCRQDFSDRKALAKHTATQHGTRVPVGFTKPELAKKAPNAPLKVNFSALIALEDVDEVRAGELAELGVTTPEQVAEMTLTALKKLSNVGPATAKRIKASAEEYCGSQG